MILAQPVDIALPPLIQQMLAPEFYPHPVRAPVQLLQTHISYLLLTGDYAYKVKKPVNFGFLDFSSLAQRGQYCHQELQLNQRWSPALYLAVVAIGQHSPSGQFILSPPISQDGQMTMETSAPFGADPSIVLVDYAVQMHQFAQADLFSHRFQHGDLTLDQIQALGQLTADLHVAAPTSTAITANGSVEGVRRVANNNYQISQPFVGGCQPTAQLAQTQAFSEQFFQAHRDWFEQRQTAGKIRDCHGDLHLNNVCFYHNQIQVFDCVEFNPDFRHIDGIYDMAFMVMDLAFQGRLDFANAFLNTYLECTGDYDGAKMLPLYLSMRAYIRGNVNALASQDGTIDPAQQEQARQRATAYYRQAWTCTQPTSGHLVLMSGLSGSGKSTVARQLAQQINAIHIRSDAVRKHLAGMPLEQRGDVGDRDIYTPAMTQKTYDRLLSLGTILAQQGWPVILDAKYDLRALRGAVIEQAQQLNLPLRILSCEAPEAVLRDRLRTRQGDITDATVDLLASQQAIAEPFSPAEQAYVTSLQTDQDWHSQLAAVIQHCERHP